MKNTISLGCLILALASCKEDKSRTYEKINAANWLLGNWESKSVEGNLTESWKKANDSTFQATSYFIKEKDTLHFETIILEQKGEKVTYYATVQGQNEDKPIAFKLKTAAEKELLFENLQHDYPQKINYTPITADSLVVKISGMQQGKSSSEQFSMKRIK
ncbi:MAG: hypothetical protein H7Z76_11080 [Methylotenera sp.]|nr:hypothetical protein [Flavobacterium sp.]